MKVGDTVETTLSNCTYECIGIRETGTGKYKTVVYKFKSELTTFEVSGVQLEMLMKKLWKIL